MKINTSYAPIAVRGGIGFVFLLIGIDIWLHIDYWVTWLPAFQFIEPATLMMFTGVFDIAIGILLLLGLFTRWVALFASLHLIGVMISLGYNDIMVRDLGLFLGSVAIWLHGPDKLCLDTRVKNLFNRQIKKILYFFD